MFAAVVIFALVVAIFLAVYWLIVYRPEAAVQAQLRRRLRPTAEKQVSPHQTVIEKPREAQIRRFETLARAEGPTAPLARLLDQAGFDMTVAKFLTISAAAALGGGVVLARIAASPLIGFPVGLFAGLIPFLWIRRRADRRAQVFEEQFPEAIDLMARALRAGHALSTGLALVADELPDPVGAEFRLVYDRQNFGMSLPDALRLFAARIPLIDARFFVTAVLTQRESGGNLAEILDNLGSVIRQRFRVRRQIRVVTAHARLTGWVLTGMPVAIGVAMAVVAPDHVRLLFQDPLGVQMLIGAVGLWVIGYLVIRRLVAIEYRAACPRT